MIRKRFDCFVESEPRSPSLQGTVRPEHAPDWSTSPLLASQAVYGKSAGGRPFPEIRWSLGNGMTILLPGCHLFPVSSSPYSELRQLVLFAGSGVNAAARAHKDHRRAVRARPCRTTAVARLSLRSFTPPHWPGFCSALDLPRSRPHHINSLVIKLGNDATPFQI